MHRRQKHAKSLFAACFLATALTPLLPGAHSAFAIDWLGTTSDWNTATNWNPTGVPNSTTATVNFNDGTPSAVNISSSATVQSLNFNNLVGNYTLTSNSSQILAVQNITVASGVGGTESINLATSTTGSILFPNTGSLTITNNSQNATLAFGSVDLIGSQGGTGGVVVNGPGFVSLASSFVIGGSTNVHGGLTKTGSGTLDFTGAGVGLLGGITLSGGTLNFDFANATASKINTTSGTLTLNGGVLNVTANSSVVVTQAIPNGTAIAAGQTDIAGLAAGTVTLNLGTTSRSAGATMDVSANAATTFTVGFAGLTTVNNILGSGAAFMTFNNGATWATSTNGTTISGLATYSANTFNSLLVNCDVTTSSSQANFSVNSLRFNTGNLSLNLTGNNVINSGGILQTPSSSGAGIFGGTLTAAAGELIVQVYSVNGMTIAASINATSLTKAGPGLLAINGNNFGLTGAININRGSLDIESAVSVNAASKISFNDLRSGNALQTFTVDVGNSVNASITPAIAVAAFGSPVTSSYGTYFSTGFSTNSRITLSGVISSSSGQSTSILLTGASANNSGFNFTNTNTFTGNISLNQGFLGINSDAALGNPANILTFQNTTTIAGGLQFLNSGINVAHNLNAAFYARIVSDNSDSNTVSGQISGAGVVIKDGTGTLTLTNTANSFQGTVINAGTLAVSSDSNLGVPAGFITVNAGTLENTATFTLSPARSINTLSGSATISTDNFTTLIITQPIAGTATFTKIGGGTLALTSTSAFSFAAVNINAGTLSVAGATFNGGAFTNNSVITGFASFSPVSGSFTNNGIILATGSLVIAPAGVSSNNGTITLAGPTMGLQLSGAPFTNAGTLNLSGAILSGNATLTNNPGGTISGPGVISTPLNNNAGATLLNSGPGALILTNSLLNSGIIQLNSASASLSGAFVANVGTITGFGTVTNVVSNTTVSGISGTIEPTGGTLTFTGTLFNTTTIRTASGTKILIQGASNFPTNAGLISLVGGTVDTGGQPLDNTGQITGYGTLSTGGLTNDGGITFTGGTTTVNGNITNAVGRTINVQYQPAVFTGNITNFGTINVTGTTITYTGTYTGNAYHSDPATNIFQNNVTIIPGGVMTGQVGDKFLFTGGTVANNGTFNNAGLLQSAVNFTNSGAFTQSGPQTWSPNTTLTITAGTAALQSDPGVAAATLSIVASGGAYLPAGPQHLAALTLTGGTLAIPLALNNSNNLITTNSLALNAGALQIISAPTGPASLGYYKAIQYSGSLQGSIYNITLPAVANNIAYTLETNHDANFIDIHRGFLGDANDDGTVNFSDFVTLSNHFGASNAGWSGGDFNGDGIVNFSDFVLLSNNFGQSATGANLTASEIAQFQSETASFAAPSSVPEPASLALLSIGAAALLTRSRRTKS